MDIMDILSQFHYFPAVWVGSDGHMAGRVQINADPAGHEECGLMKSDHLSLVVIQPLYEIPEPVSTFWSMSLPVTSEYLPAWEYILRSNNPD